MSSLLSALSRCVTVKLFSSDCVSVHDSMDNGDDKAREKQPRQKSTNRKPLLNGQFTFKDDETVVCKHCNGEFKCHRSTSTLSYHLCTKHAFVSLTSSSSGTNTTQTAARQPSLSDMFERARPMEQARYDSITNAIAKWIATNSRPTNIESPMTVYRQ